MCAWLTVGNQTPGGKKFRGDYCKVHLAKIQKNRPIPVPCRICEKGTQSEIQFSDCSLVRISRGEYNEVKKRIQQTDELEENKLCEKGVKSVIKKIIEKYRDHRVARRLEANN